MTAGLISAGAAFAAAERVEMPSGLTGYLHEVIADESAGLYRFRFVAPAFSVAAALEVVAADLDHLCAEIALPEVPEGGQIIVSLADQATEFGVANPDVTQVFEAYRAENGRCMWEEF
ncbi:MAG: DUF6497 family protein [Pseudomonadota bacterium]